MPKDRVEEYARQWGAPSVQRVLDTALAWSVINRHFDVADFLLEHGADINTNWNSHEPASILHELVFHANYESMQFLIDRGIDMTIKDYRWNGTAQGWALLRREGREDGPVAGGCGTAAETETMSTPRSFWLWAAQVDQEGPPQRTGRPATGARSASSS